MNKRTILTFALIIFSIINAQQTESFESLLNEINNLPQNEKQEKAEQYFNTITSYPIVDGNTATFVVKGKYENDVKFSADFTDFTNPPKMEKVEGLDIYYYTKELANDARIEYYFYHGEKVFIDPLNPNKCWRWGSQASLLKMPKYKEPKYFSKLGRNVNGQILKDSLFSEYLGNKREVYIYLPVSYKSSSKSYPVLYTQDGDVYTGIVRLPYLADYMQNRNLTREFIIVSTTAIERGREYRDDKTSEYKQFFTKELIPHIEKNYRTERKKEGRTLLGYSRGGLISLDLISEYPNIFKTVIAQSPAIPPRDIISHFKDKHYDNRFIISVGVYEKRWLEDVRKLVKFLKANNVDVDYNENNEIHSVFSWGKWLEDILPELYSIN